MLRRSPAYLLLLLLAAAPASAQLHHFLVDAKGGGTIGTQTAGAHFFIEIVAQDSVNSTVTSFNGTVNLTSDGTLSFGGGTSIPLIDGVLSSKEVALTSPGTFTITATNSAGSESGTSSAITIVPGAAASFLVEASGGGPIPGATAGAPLFIKITAHDSVNNVATGFTGTVNITSTGTLSAGGGTSAAFSAGVLTGASVTFSNTGSFTVTATRSGGAETGTSNAFTVSPGALASFLVEASGGGPIGTQTAGAAFPLRITAKDGFNNTITGFTGTVDLSSTGTLSAGGGTTPAFTAGVLASQSVTISNTGSFTITATHTGAAEAGTSNAFTVNPGPAASFLVEASGGGAIPGATAGAPLFIKITAHDSVNNVATGFNGTVNITSTGTLSAGGGTSAAFTAGVLNGASVTFSSAGSFTITATRSGGTEHGTSNSFTVSPGALASFLVEASGGGPIGTQSAGTAFPLRITAKDGFNNTIAGFTGTVDLSSTGALSAGGGTTPAFTAGVLASQSVTISNTGSFTITATHTGAAEAGTSNAFTVNPGAASRVQVETAADGTGAVVPAQNFPSGSSMTVYAVTRDPLSNFVANVAATAWSLQNRTGGVAASNLVPSADRKSAVFTGALTGTAAIQATSGTLTVVSSGTITVVPGPASHLAFVQEPSNELSGVVITPAPTVRLLDAAGNLVRTPGVAVAMAVSSGGLHGTTPQPTDTNGLAAFGDLTVDTAGTKTLTASSAGLAPGVSTSFTISAGPAARLAFIQQPSNALSSVVIAPSITVQIQDIGGNTVRANNQAVSMALSTGTGTLAGTLTRNTNGNGLASFNDLSVNLAGAKQLTAARAGLISAASDSFTIAPGPLANFLVEAAAGGPIGAQSAGAAFGVRITARDAAGNTVTSFTGTVNVTSTGTLTRGGGVSAAFVNGVAVDSAVISNTGTFTIAATNTAGAQSGTSAPFAVAAGPVASYLVEAAGGGAIGTQTAGSAFSIRITARDALNNTAAGFSGTVDLSSTGTLVAGGGTTPAFTAGVLASRSVMIGNTGSFTITATTTGGAENGTSNAFTVNPGAVKGFFVEAPAGGPIPPATAGIPLFIKITAHDSLNNTTTGFTGTVNITSTGTISAGGGTSEPFVSGILASHSVTISNTGSFTITATRTGGTEAGTSNAFTVAPGALHHFLVEAVAGGAIPPQSIAVPFAIRVTAQDVNNNTAASFTGTVDITSNGTLLTGGGTTAAFTAGVLASHSVSYSSTGSFTITATHTGAAEAGTSASFSVAAGPAVTVGVETAADGSGAVVPAQSLQSGSGITAYAVTRDTFGNFVANTAADTWSVAAAAGGVAAGDLVPAPDRKSALFTGHLTGTGQIHAAFGLLVPVNSGTLTVTPGAAARVAFVQQPPVSAVSAALLSPAPSVALRDAAGNAVPSAGVTVGMALNGSGTLAGTLAHATDGTGSAAFADLSIDSAGTKRLIASSPGLAPDTSTAFTVTPGALAGFFIEKAGTGGPIDTQIVQVPFAVRVTARDAAGNTVTSFVNTVDITSTGTLTRGAGGSASFSAGVLAADTLAFGSAGTFTVTATLSRGTTSGTSNAFTVANPLPVTSSISPAVKNMGDAGFTLTVDGSGFTAASIVQINGSPRTTTFVNAGQLTAAIPASDLAAAASLAVTVFTAAPGGGVSNAQSLAVIGLAVSARVFLQGPYAAGAMSTALRSAGLIPLAQPYNAAPWNYAGGEHVASIPANAVDWILVELRTGTSGATIAGTRAGLLLSDGTIVDTNGAALSYAGVPAGNYYVVVRHRNHIAVMSAAAVPLNGAGAPVDFTAGAAFGTAPMALLAPGVFGMYAGDVTSNGTLKYSGAGNDSGPIYARIGGASVSATAAGYFREDTNMNGVVKYSGSGNDRAIIYANIGGASVSATVSTQVPP